MNLFQKGLIIPLILLLIYTPWSSELDLWTSQQFYTDGHFRSSPFLDFIFIYGLWPAWIIVGLATVGLFKQNWRRSCLYLLMTLALGSGVIIHGAFKEHWGRPRPKQTIEFGGTQAYRPYYSPNFLQQPEPSKSFSCGHCSLGFYFFALAFLGLHYRNRKIFWLGCLLTIVFGGLLSYARIAQGGHFLSDVIISALIMWWTALFLFIQFVRLRLKFFERF